MTPSTEGPSFRVHVTGTRNPMRSCLRFSCTESIVPPPVKSWQRHLEGWQLAVAAVGVAVTSMVLVLPRSVVPGEIPLPTVDREEAARAAHERRALAHSAERMPLPLVVRAAGESIRAFGEAEYRNDAAGCEKQARDIVARIAAARAAVGEKPLLALRAVQTELFVRALTTWASSRREDRDVIELGGGFARRANRNGWVQGRHLALSQDGLAQIFLVRWTRLAGLTETRPFIATLNELRLYYGTLMKHPDARVDDFYAQAEALGGYVTALHRHDPDYPAALAGGIVAFRQGDFQDATELLAGHLKEHPGGPWRLRAQNYFVAARLRRQAAAAADGEF